MVNDITEMWRDVLGVMRQNIRQIFLTHVSYTALVVILFNPLIGIIDQLLLQLSAQSALSDQNIVYSLLKPLGITALILFAGLLITILSFEQASLMMIRAGSLQGRHISTI